MIRYQKYFNLLPLYHSKVNIDSNLMITDEVNLEDVQTKGI